MKYSKLENDGQYSIPDSLEKIIFDSGVSVPRDTKSRVNFVKSLGYLEVKESSIPVPPPELNGKCRVSLGRPVMGKTGILERTYEFVPATDTQIAFIAQKNRAKRDELLKTTVDNMNPIRWETLTVDQKAAWTQYRQDLLDVPAQPGFPCNVVWPKLPA